MKINYINLSKKNRKKYACILCIFFLIISFVSVQYFESKQASSNKLQFAYTTEDCEFVLGGEACGIKLLGAGVLVVEVDNPKLNLDVGDIILKLDDTKIDSNKELIDYINKDDIKGKEIKITVKKDNKEKVVKTTPVYNEESKMYELGIWVKDSSAGVGMITFYELNNKYFAALGHGITETRENIVLPIKTGAIVKSKIVKINKGIPKEPGDIRGTIYKQVFGQIRLNTMNGIYGILEDESIMYQNKETIRAASIDEIKVGIAKVYCTLDEDGPKAYDIEIKNIMKDSSSNKNMIIQVTDDELIQKTGGIVQGMSGSPIVQNGKLVGAITHVFLNDPTKGYAVFVQNMIEDMNTIEKE